MIPICGKYYLTADNNSYILNKAHTTREGKTAYDAYTYHVSLDAALNAAIRYTIRDGVARKKLTTLEQVIAKLQRTKAEVSHSVMMLAPDAVLGKIRQTQDAPLNGTCSS